MKEPGEAHTAIGQGTSRPSNQLGLAEAIGMVRRGATDLTPVSGATHKFYRYPARFSPRFAEEAIKALSKPGEIVLDPFVGGGTCMVEGLIANRRVVGNDLNSLAVFLAGVKTSPLCNDEQRAIEIWASDVVPSLLFSRSLKGSSESAPDEQIRNMQIPRARAIKKILALALESLSNLPSSSAQAFVRCVLLNAGQWALNGKRHPVSATEFRERLVRSSREMLLAIESLRTKLPEGWHRPVLINGMASDLGSHPFFASGNRADLVVTSPPYPGIHILYHRWQIDGRKESPAPYWLAACRDGQGSAYYNMGDRRDLGAAHYFAGLLHSFVGIRQVMKPRAFVVQLVAFADPQRQLPRFLRVMQQAGFDEVRLDDAGIAGTHRRIWRDVPGRTWHAQSQGRTHSAREVVLVHRAG